MKPAVFCLMGPTAIGKTELACLLSDEFPFELVNVDSSLVYQELNIGAAKPDRDQLNRYPHYLVDICDLQTVYSVAQFCEDVHRICYEILARGRYPLLVGGTMMYFHAFQHGLAKLPEASQTIREKVNAYVAERGLQAMYDELVVFDPISAARIHPHDQQRLTRAFEIYWQSGQTWSSLLQDTHFQQPFDCHHLALFPEPRSWLHERISLRFHQMIDQGFIEEVQSILKTPNVNLEHPALRSVGYRQAIMYLQGELDAALWQEKAIAATRQLAKRQMTWLRSFENRVDFFQPSVNIFKEIVACIQKILDNQSSSFLK